MCWGLNTDNRLGVKTEEDFIGKPTAIEALKAQGVSLISSGNNTSSAVTVDGRLYTWGKNMINNSQLLGTFLPLPWVTQSRHGRYLPSSGPNTCSQCSQSNSNRTRRLPYFTH